MRSAEPMATVSGRPAVPPKLNTRECSRNRSTTDRTRMCSDRPGTPGRRQQRLRTITSTDVPAREAR